MQHDCVGEAARVIPSASGALTFSSERKCSDFADAVRCEIQMCVCWRQRASGSSSLLNLLRFPGGGREVHCYRVLSFTGAGGQPLRCSSKTCARRFGALARMATSAAPGQRHCASFCRVQYSPHRAVVRISSACSSQPANVPSSKNSAVHLPMRSSLLFLMHFVSFVALENMHRRKEKN